MTCSKNSQPVENEHTWESVFRRLDGLALAGPLLSL